MVRNFGVKVLWLGFFGIRVFGVRGFGKRPEIWQSHSWEPALLSISNIVVQVDY